MSIAQFDATSAASTAAQIGASNGNTTTTGDFARLLSDAQQSAQAAETTAQSDVQAARDDARRADEAAAPVADQAAEARRSQNRAAPDKTSDTKASSDGSKTHRSHHTGRASDDATQAASDGTQATGGATLPVPAAPTPTTQPQPQPQTQPQTQTQTAAAADGNDTTDATGSSASSTSTSTTSTTGTAATTAAAVASETDPALAALATLGLGRSSAVPGAGTSLPPAGGKGLTAAANVSVTRAPAAVKFSALTTALPQDLGTAETVDTTTETLDPAAASAAANVAAANDEADAPNGATVPADPGAAAQAALPADFAAALATATDASAATIAPQPATTVAATAQHGSLFSQGGTDTTTGPTAQPSGTAPDAAGFATVNAGTTVSRAETASTPSQNGQTGQTPLPLPAEQLAVAISRNAGRDGSQNFTIKLSPEKLGSVEVQLKVDSKGKTTANFVVEHAETLSLLKQDSQQLVQSLQNAGVDTSGASLSFSLRDPNTGTAQNQSGGNQGRQAAAGVSGSPDGTDTADAPAIASNRLYDIQA